MILNLGMSQNFGTVDLVDLTFPANMYIDYVRVYQRKNAKNIGVSSVPSSRRYCVHA